MEWRRALEQLGLEAHPPEEALPVESRILSVTGRDVGAVAVATGTFGTRRGQIQVRRVLAGRYQQQNFVGVAVLEAPDVTGTASVRRSEWRRFVDFVVGAPWWSKLLLLPALPIGGVVMLPGYLLVVTAVTLGKRARGIRPRAVGLDPLFSSSYVVEATSEADARGAVPVAVQRAIALAAAPRVELTPGRIAVEVMLDRPGALAALVRERAAKF